MDALRRTLEQISQQMRGLGLSQRLTLMLSAVLVAGAVLWIAQWAATPDLEPLLPQDFEPAELAQVQAGLGMLGQDYEVRGQRVYVPASANRLALLAGLQEQNRLPTDTSDGFAALVKDSSPWISQEESKRRWSFALKNELEKVLSSFQGVKRASVFLNLDTGRRMISRAPALVTASVRLSMTGGEPAT